MRSAPMRDAAARRGPAVEVRDLSIAYGDATVVHGVSLEVGRGEIVSLLGPSGCGKTTTLRAIAGFVDPSAGSIHVDGADVTDVPANRRDIGMVFQGYALFPHLSVFDNVAYGLRMRKVARDAIRARVAAALERVKLAEYADRRPRQLSGGQQQRVAIARALVIEPKVLLLDEPLSNLDAKLRHEMRVELRRLLKSMDVASVFVTHDQEEAMVLSDRIVLMNAGRIEQLGTPLDIYQQPGTLFAAAFIGSANFLTGVVKALPQSDRAVVEVEGVALRGVPCGELRPGDSATVVVKHEHVRVGAEAAHGDNVAEAEFEIANFLGAHVQMHCAFRRQRLVGLAAASRRAMPTMTQGERVRLAFHETDALVFPDRPAA